MNAVMAVIDRDLALQRAGGNSQLADELFGMLLRELPTQRSHIESARALRDFPSLQFHVHKLNGSATYCGVPALKAAAETVESHLKRGETAQAEQTVDALLDAIDDVLQAAP